MAWNGFADAQRKFDDMRPTLVAPLSRDIRARGIEGYGEQMAAAEEMGLAVSMLPAGP